MVADRFGECHYISLDNLSTNQMTPTLLGHVSIITNLVTNQNEFKEIEYFFS